jgi:hypothetical protein
MALLDPLSFTKCGSEHGHQTALFVWASQNFKQYPDLRMMFAIPNGGERNKAVAANLKAEGVKRSVPDIFLPVSRGAWHGLFIEMKRPASQGKAEGRVDPEQAEYIEALRARGYGACVCVGFEQARDTLLAYLNWQ